MSEYTAERAEHRANHFENAGILDIAAMLRAYAATLSKPADSGRVDANCIDVLRRLRDMLPTVGICGWPAGVSALDEAISTLAAQGQGDAVAEVCSMFELRWAGVDSISSIVERNRIKVGDKLYTHPSPAASPAGVPDSVERCMHGCCCGCCQACKNGSCEPVKYTACDCIAAAPSAPEGDGGGE